MKTELKQYTGLQKVLKRVGDQGMLRLPNGAGTVVSAEIDAVETLAFALGVERKTIINWLRADGVQLVQAKDADSPIYKAVTAYGGPTAAAATMGVTTQAVRQWIAQGYVPTKRVAEFSIQFGVPRELILSPKVRSASGAGGEL